MTTIREIQAGRAAVTLSLRDGLDPGLARAQARMKAFGRTVQNLGVGMMMGGTAVVAPLLAAAKQFASTGDAVAKAARRTGLSTEAVSELGFAAEQSGSNLEGLEAGVRRMQRAVVDAAQGTKEARDALASLGLTAADLQGLSPERQLETLADRIAAVVDPTLKASVAMDLFGRGGTQLIPLMERGAAGMQELRERARALGLTIGGEDARAAEVLDDTLNELGRSVRATAFAVGSALAPVVVDAAQRLSRAAADTRGWVEANRGLVAGALKLGAVFAGIGAGLTGAGQGLMLMVSHPVIAGLAALAAGLYGVKKTADELAESIYRVQDYTGRIAAPDWVTAWRRGVAERQASGGGASPPGRMGDWVGTRALGARAQVEEDLARAGLAVRIAAIAEEEQRAIASVHAEYDERVRAARAAGVELTRVEEARLEALLAVTNDFARRRAETEAQAEQQAMDRRRSVEISNIEALERARIDAIEDETERRLARLNHEERLELAAAVRVGASLEPIMQRYELLWKAAKASENLPAQTSVAGLFQGRLSGLGAGSAERRLVAQGDEQIRIAREMVAKVQEMIALVQFA